MIYISAGHHPSKPGACFGDFCEHEEARVWASLIANHLGQEGMVVPVGTLRKKVDFINDHGRDEPRNIAIEVHFNAAVNADGENVGRGCETLYYPGSKMGADLATAVQNAMGPIFPPGRGVKEGYYKMDPARGPDFFLARTRWPAVILEPEFIHRVEIIQSNRASACAAIAEALNEFYKFGR